MAQHAFLKKEIASSPRLDPRRHTYNTSSPDFKSTSISRPPLLTYDNKTPTPTTQSNPTRFSHSKMCSIPHIPSITLPAFVFTNPAASILLPITLGSAVGYSTQRLFPLPTNSTTQTNFLKPRKLEKSTTEYLSPLSTPQPGSLRRCGPFSTAQWATPLTAQQSLASPPPRALASATSPLPARHSTPRSLRSTSRGCLSSLALGGPLRRSWTSSP